MMTNENGNINYEAPQTPQTELPQPEPPQPPVPPQSDPNAAPPNYAQGAPGGNQNGPYQPPQYWQNPGPQNQPSYYPPQQPRGFYPPPGYQQKSRLAAGLLGISFGMLGVHNFYLGFRSKAVIQLILCLFIFTAFIPLIWGMIEGILLIIGGEGHNFDGNGIILKD